MVRGIVKQHAIVGLDIGRSSIKAAQVSMTSKGPRLGGLLCVRRSSHGGALVDAEAGMLMRAMTRCGIVSKRLALVARSDALVGASVSLPGPDTSVARDPVVKMEISRTHRLHPDSFEYAWWDLPANASGGRIGSAHAVALPHAAVSATLDTFDALGLEVVRTVPASIALLAAVQRRGIDPSRIAAMIDLGSRSAHLVLVHAGRVVHERSLPEFDPAAIRARIGEALGTDDTITRYALGHFGLCDEPSGAVACETTGVLNDAVVDLAEQIGMSFSFISHLYPQAELGPLLLAGGGANIPGLAQLLSKELELETGILTPESLMGADDLAQLSCDPAVTTALGAALDAAGGGR